MTTGFCRQLFSIMVALGIEYFAMDCISAQENSGESISVVESTSSADVEESSVVSESSDIVAEDGCLSAEMPDTTWRDMFDGIYRLLSGEQKQKDMSVDAALIRSLGFDENLKAGFDVFKQVKSFSTDNVLNHLLDEYWHYLQVFDVSSGYTGEDMFSSLDDDTELSSNEKTSIVQTIYPLFIYHSANINDVVALRKYRAIYRSYERIWPNRRMNIVCQHDEKAIKFDVFSLIPGAALTGEMIEPQINLCAGDRAGVQECLNPEDSVICYSLIERSHTNHSEKRIELLLSEVLFALQSKDNDLITDVLDELSGNLEGLYGRYHINASWNRHYDHAPLSKWLCEFQVITLMLLEQHRFAELSRFERVVQKIYPGATFYRRLNMESICAREMSKAFSDEYERLNTDYGSLYSWVRRQYSEKHIKKLEKSFASWTKKGSAAVLLSRRLIVAWTLWSDGKYEQAGAYAGDVSAQKSRIVHPQLHSFEMMLKAIRKEEIPQELLETYIRVVYLKNPSLVYETLSEAGRWFSKGDRQFIVDNMIRYSPGVASSAAARFFLEYESELRSQIEPGQLAQIDAWLETEFRGIESENTANRRRIQWLKDLNDTGDYQGIKKLSQLSLSDSESLEWQTYWQSVLCNAEAVLTDGDVCQNEDIAIVKGCELNTVETPTAWITRAASCIQ